MFRSAPDRTDGQGRSKKEKRVKEEKESIRKSKKFHKEENSKKRKDEKIEKIRTKSGKDGSHRRLKGYKVYNRSSMQRNSFLSPKYRVSLKKGTFLIFCLISVLEVGFYFSTCVSESEF